MLYVPGISVGAVGVGDGLGADAEDDIPSNVCLDCRGPRQLEFRAIAVRIRDLRYRLTARLDETGVKQVHRGRAHEARNEQGGR